jgi:hypothetical protein
MYALPAVDISRERLDAEIAYWDARSEPYVTERTNLGRAAQFTTKALDGDTVEVGYRGISTGGVLLKATCRLTRLKDAADPQDRDAEPWWFVSAARYGRPDFSMSHQAAGRGEGEPVSQSEAEIVVKSIRMAAYNFAIQFPERLIASACKVEAVKVYRAIQDAVRKRQELAEVEALLAAATGRRQSMLQTAKLIGMPDPGILIPVAS